MVVTMTAQRADSFADALRAAIAARGLGLERIRDRLLRHGVSVSPATLSYWQSGRSRPERRESLQALALLEEILDVERGALAALLGPPRPRGRRTPDPAFTAFWPAPAPVADAVSAVDTRWDDRLTRLSQHDLVTVGPDRAERSFRSRQVLRAECAGPDRWVVVLHLDEHGQPPPLIRPVRHCRLGRTVSRPEDGLLVAELLFDHPLNRGETIITEHELVTRPPHPLATNYDRKFRRPVREYVLEVCFDPAALPASCVRHEQWEGADERVTPVRPAASVHGVALGFGPGCYGFRWEWPPA
jgi:transcriptional regulator with XRE-family HTH domain